MGFGKIFWGFDEKSRFWGEQVQQEENKQEVDEARGGFAVVFQRSAVEAPVTGGTVTL